MPDISSLVKRWWKQILFTVAICLVGAGVISFLKPRLYLSMTTALPASSVASDRARIFNENIQALYSSLGNADDLDMIIGTSKLDTAYLAVTDAFNLFDHYKIKVGGEVARNKAAGMLKKNTTVMKSEYGELKVKVWDTDKNLAPQLANAIMDKLQTIHTDLKSKGNAATLEALIRQRTALQQQSDSAGGASHGSRLLQYDQMISEYQLMVDSKPPVLFVVEKAKAATAPDKPRIVRTMAATAVFSLLFALLLALLLESRKTNRE